MYTANITLAITGASGVQYAISLLKALVKTNMQIYLLISNAAEQVIKIETSFNLPNSNHELGKFFTELCNAKKGQIKLCDITNWLAPPASGSSNIYATIIIPCSMGSLSAIANGASNNLIERAADVALKEKRKLIIVPRETPLSSIHLQNMLTLSNAGAIIAPACPGFYHKPQNIDDITSFMTAKILNLLNIKQDLLAKWGQ